MTGAPGPGDRGDETVDEVTDAGTVDDVWRELVSVALLGTDRRDPPDLADGPASAVDDLVADAVRPTPSERFLAQVAAVVAVRRAAVLPGPSVDPLVPPAVDDRPECAPAAVDRWHHLTASWPVLEDEWTIALVSNGWRLAGELVSPILRRHRTDPVRRARAMVAAGPLGEWLVDQLPDLAGTRRRVDPESLGELPDLPIPPDLAGLLHRPGAEVAADLARGLEAGTLAAPHRAVLVNLLARVAPDGLLDVAAVLDAVDPVSPGAGLASVLADLATTRHRMLDELTR